MRDIMAGAPLDAYKLLRLRRDGTLGPLFINRQQVIPAGQWLRAESWPTKNFKLRPGWHVTQQPYAPHLKMEGRIWMRVQVDDIQELPRPLAQGGLWWIARWLRVVEPVRKT